MNIIKLNMIIGLFLIGGAGLNGAFAQKQLDLDECVKIALNNNLDIARNRNDARITAANLHQSKFEFVPSLNATVNYGWRNGLAFDNTTGEVVNQRTQNSNPSVDMSVPIFQGMQNINTLQRNKLAQEAAEFDIESSINRTEIQVTGFYLQVLLSKENMKISENRIELLEAQLERAEKRVQLGVENNQQVYNLKSQIANERLNLVNANNTFLQNKLALLQALLLDPTEDYEIVGMEINELQVTSEEKPYESIYDAARGYSPNLKSADLGRTISKRNLSISKAGLYPNISGTVSYGSTYFVNADDENAIGYLDQLQDNRSSFVGLRMNIPIFNSFRVRNDMQIAKINQDGAEIEYQQAEIDLHNTLQQAYLDWLTARSTYQASLENYAALEQAFKFSETSYKTGNADFYSYIEALNNLNRAELELNNAKYSIVFRKRILEVLQGYR